VRTLYPKRDEWRAVRVSSRRLLHQLHAGDGFEILVVDLLAVGLGNVERVENPQRLAYIHRAAFRIEWAIGGEDDLLQRVELEPGLGCRHGGERGSVSPEVLLEVVERPLLQALAQGDIVLVAGARTQHVPARADAAFQHRNDAAEM